MNRRQTVFAALLSIGLLSSGRTAVATGEYTIDPTHTSVVFSVGHAGLSYTYGFFREASGSYTLNPDPAGCRFQLTIQANSLDTNNAKRDEHLRSPDFFNVQQFPTITFESTNCNVVNTPEGGIEYQVRGILSLHGVRKQIVVPLRLLAEGKGPYGDPRTGFLCQLTLNRSDYGMSNLLENDLVGDAVSITISFEGVRQDAATNQQRPR